MSNETPVTQRPTRQTAARPGLMNRMAAMLAAATMAGNRSQFFRGRQNNSFPARHGKHNGRTAGAFGGGNQ